MIDAFHSIVLYFQSVNLSGMYYGLFAVALFAMFYMSLLDKDDVLPGAARRFYFATGVITLIFLCPLTVWFYTREISWSFGLPQFMRLLPLTPFIAMTFITGAEYSFSQRKGNVRYSVAVVLIIVLCGSILPYASDFNMSSRFMTCDDFEKEREIRNICEKIDTEFDGQKIVLSDMDTMPRLRRQSGQVLPLYGPDMWNSTVNREFSYEGEHRYSDYMISVCGYMIGLDTLTGDMEDEDEITYSDLYGTSKTTTCRELVDTALVHIRNTNAELLILRADVADNAALAAYMKNREWLKTKHYTVYMLR